MRPLGKYTGSGEIATLVAAIALAATPARAVEYAEIGTHASRETAQPIAFPHGMLPGDSITGLTTGFLTEGSGTNTADWFRVKIAPLDAPGIYRTRFRITTAGSQGHTAGLMGWAVAADGSISAGSGEAPLVSSVDSTSPPRYVQWFGFGGGEIVTLRIKGTFSTTEPYAATLERSPVHPVDLPGVFRAGTITVAAAGAADAELWVLNDRFEPVQDFGNDQNTFASGGSGSGNDAVARRVLEAGTYYVAVAARDLATNFPNPADDRRRTGAVWEQPGALSGSSATGGEFSVTVGDGTDARSAGVSAAGAYEVAFVRFAVAGRPIHASGTVEPGYFGPGATVQLAVRATPSADADNLITSVEMNLTQIGGPAAYALSDAGLGGDAVAGDGVFSAGWTVPPGALPGPKTVLFRVADASGRTVSGTVPVQVDPVAPPNGDCTAATPLGETALPFSATLPINFAPGGGAGPCSTFANNTVWYSHTPAVDGILRLAETGPRDVNWAVYEGPCGGAPLVCDESDVDAAVLVRAGVNYRIEVYTPGSPSASPADAYTISISREPLPPPPPNDGCASARDLTGVPLYTQTLLVGGATPDPASSCMSGLATAPNGVWYRYTAFQDIALQVAETDPAVGGFVSVYGGCGGPELACLRLGGTAGPAGYAVIALPGSPAGITHWILISRDRQGSRASTYALSFAFTPDTMPSRRCETAPAITSLPATLTATEVLGLEGPAVPCGGRARWATWASYTPPHDQVVSFEADEAVVVFSGTCDALSPYWCDPVFSVQRGFANRLRLLAGRTYFFMQHRGTPPGNAGVRRFRIFDASASAAPPPHDVCTAAKLITLAPHEETIMASGAGDDRPVGCSRPLDVFVPFPVRPAAQNNGVWYRYDNGPRPTVGVLEATGTTTNFGQVAFGVYAGSCPDADFSETACAAAGPPERAALRFAMAPLTTYYILVSAASQVPNYRSHADEQLGFRFDVVDPAAPAAPHHRCDAARVIGSLPFRDVVYSHALPDEPTTLACSSAAGARNAVWFRYTTGPGETGFLAFSEESAQAAVVGVFSGCPAGGGALLRCASLRPGAENGETGVLAVSPSTTYYFLVGRHDGGHASPGQYWDFRLGPVATPLHDSCSAAKEIVSFPFTDIVPHAGLAPDTPPTAGCLSGTYAAGVWYRFIARDAFALGVAEQGPSYSSAARAMALWKVDPAEPCSTGRWIPAGCSPLNDVLLLGYGNTPAPFGVQPGGEYYLFVGQRAAPTDPDARFYRLHFYTVGSDAGRCCGAPGCGITSRQNCSGTFTPGAPLCAADHDGAGGLDLLDIFAFLEDWFAGSPRADFDRAGGVDLLDIFAFLKAWFAGC